MDEPQNADDIPRVEYVRVEDTTWPVSFGSEWVLRYGTTEAREVQRMGVASIISAYQYLVDPQLPQQAAIAALKRARKACAIASTSPASPDTEETT